MQRASNFRSKSNRANTIGMRPPRNRPAEIQAETIKHNVAPFSPDFGCSDRADRRAVSQENEPKHEIKHADKRTGRVPARGPSSAMAKQKRRPAPIRIPSPKPFFGNYEINEKTLKGRKYSTVSLEEVSPKSLPQAYSKLDGYQVRDDRSESCNSPRSSEPSPITKKGKIVCFSPIAHPWAAPVDFLSLVDQLENLVMDQIFLAATAEFFNGLDVDALVNPEYALGNHEKLRESPEAFDLEPHFLHENRSCMSRQDGTVYDLEEHQENIRCSCAQCSICEDDEQQRQPTRLEQNFVKEFPDEWCHFTGGLVEPACEPAPTHADESILNILEESEAAAGCFTEWYPDWLRDFVDFVLRDE